MTTRPPGSDIRIFSGGAPQETLEHLAPLFEARSGHRVRFTFAHVSIIQKKLGEGEAADVVLLPTSLMAGTERDVGLVPGSMKVLARIGVGVLVREGATRPDISTAAAVRDMLLNARAIAVPKPEGLTGAHIMGMMQKLGVADQVRAKLRHKPAIEGAGDLVASGEAEVGLYLASEIQSVPGAALAGLLPEELQNYVVYSVAIPAANSDPAPAAAFIDFISSPASADAWRKTGFQLV